jgi:hypothetical protein
MNSSVFSLLNGFLYFIILQFYAFVSPPFVGCSVYYGVENNYVNMPVVTRSRAKILCTSINEVENVLSSTNISINEIPGSIHEHPSSNKSLSTLDKPSCTDFSSSINLPFTGSSILVHHSSSSLQLLDSGQGDYPPIDFSKFQNSEISNCPCSLSVDCHNFLNNNFYIMESDCEDRKEATSSISNGPDIAQLFASLSAQRTYQTNCLQDKLSTDFLEVVQAHDKFKQEVHDELDELQALIAQQGSASRPWVVRNTSSSIEASSSPSSVLPTATPSLNGTTTSSSSALHSTTIPLTSGVDLQTQMLTMLTDSFFKLYSVILDKNTDTKSDWPKFSGDTKKFRAWYMSISAQLSLLSWKELYDSSTDDIVVSTSNDTLNGKLYSKLLLSLDGQPLQDVITRMHLHANGIVLLRELSQTYKPRNVPEVIVAKTGEFWSKLKRKPTETVDAYYNHFHELLEELSEADDKISDKSAMRHFIFTLGVEFEPIQNMYRIGSLPAE